VGLAPTGKNAAFPRRTPRADIQTNPPLVVIMLNGCKDLVDKLEQIEVPMVDDGKEADAYLIHE
jgi:hypothetical protein